MCGRAVIENGRVVDDERALAGPRGVHVEVGDEGRLALALICERVGDAWLGYAASAERHTYFRYREGALALIAPDEADGALEEIAFRLVDEWLWYDEEDAALERARYAHYGYRYAAPTSSRRRSRCFAAVADRTPRSARRPSRCAPRSSRNG